MRTALAALALLLLWSVSLTPACAHRLDEFLQATTIALAKDQVAVQLRLTPGVAVAGVILADLQPDENGIIAEAAQRAYADRVSRDLSLRLDGKLLSLRLVSSTFPPVEAIQEGLGEIVLNFQSAVPPGGPDRRLVFENHHRSAIAAYLVNCLSPSDPGIHVISQSRNFAQSFYEVDYTDGLS